MFNKGSRSTYILRMLCARPSTAWFQCPDALLDKGPSQYHAGGQVRSGQVTDALYLPNTKGRKMGALL